MRPYIPVLSAHLPSHPRTGFRHARTTGSQFRRHSEGPWRPCLRVVVGCSSRVAVLRGDRAIRAIYTLISTSSVNRFSPIRAEVHTHPARLGRIVAPRRMGLRVLRSCPTIEANESVKPASRSVSNICVAHLSQIVPFAGRPSREVTGQSVKACKNRRRRELEQR
jgi:hypothetical protein